ncbi:MAG: Gfo/Idh/MocA family oxidoreductase [Atopobiaceae bacterium]|nr:Gfo/Idh/MocA family oxidoreductase [Atopobiaceae bacterium]
MVRFGILGAGNIARRFAASLAHEDRASLVAASCRTTSKAAAFLDGVPHNEGARAYGSHDELLSDDGVDAIYLALPHDLHHEWALRALRAGKAVLCEKPAMLSATQMEEVARASLDEGVLFMEAMKPRFTAIYPKVRRAIDKIGELRSVEATLCNDMLGLVEGTGSYHMAPGPGAGVLLDCGTYCASWIEDLCAKDPEVLRAECVRKDGVDVYVDARMDCGGVEARLECAFDRAKQRRATIVGTRGTLVVDELHRPQAAVLRIDGAEEQTIDAPYEVDDFFGEVRHFVGLVESDKTESDVMSLASSVRCAAILDAVRAAM